MIDGAGANLRDIAKSTARGSAIIHVQKLWSSAFHGFERKLRKVPAWKTCTGK